jgi:transglutaminase-like putative cysteine protease
MKFEITATLEYSVIAPATIILNIHALRTPNQAVLSEALLIEPYVKAEELTSSHGENRFVRMDIVDSGDIAVHYNATVDNAFKEIAMTDDSRMSVSQLDTTVFPYLYPSRYCQSDRLYRFANQLFGYINNPFEQVTRIVEWINSNVEYLSGSTNSQTSAYDTITELAGVCRDFAHVGIALCRALTIPARYFTGYAYMLNPPDFHACFEAYIGGEWIIFDATKLAPLNGLIKIATGRDAADTAVATIFGNVYGKSIVVNCNALDDGFTPRFYNPSVMNGISYL